MLFVVDAEYDAGAEEALLQRKDIAMLGSRAYVHVGVRGPIVVLVVPEALGGDANALPAELADDGLHDDLVARDREV